MNKENKLSPPNAQTAGQSRKLTYRPPTFTAYGAVRKLTQGSSGTFADGGTMQPGPCL
jgi:hypothetical protein